MAIQSLNELDEIFDSVYPNQINLKSFNKKKTLCPRIWQHGDLKRIIRKHLEVIAKNFIKDLEMEDIEIYDIVLVGSIAGYNWSKYSDIDLHIIIDFSSLSNHGDKETLKKFFDLKKNDWNQKHNILIYGYPVEIYIQDTDEVNQSNGIYSVKYAKWVKIPTSDGGEMDKELIKRQASQYINIIDKIEELSNLNLNKRQCSILKNEIKKIHDEIVNGRRQTLPKEGEFGSANIVFKVLRRSGHLQKMKEIKTRLFDKINSL